jgi:uncharacterized protein YabN with tetrapyrrole methylase and pyrophosphatase domain
LDKVREEVDEVAAHIGDDGTVRDAAALESELGDLLFAVVNLARKTGVHPALALDGANKKFTARYAAMEQLATERGLEFAKLSLEEQDALWEAVKKNGG